MTSKKRTNFPLPNDAGSSFEDEDFILNYKPRIEFIEPDQEDYEAVFPEELETIDSIRDRTTKLINGLDSAIKLIDLAQKRIDDRVNSGGGVTIKLDPQKDAVTIAAMKRRFPTKEDPTEITYDDYKSALDCLQKSAPDSLTITAQDLQAARTEPYRTNFGGLQNQRGENRAEISAPTSSIEPLDMDVFQKSAVLALFAMMLPLIKIEDKKEVLEHLATVPHL